MKKLELEHLAPYLPYGLKCKYPSEDTIWECDPLGYETDFDDNKLPLFHLLDYPKCKPILHPLSEYCGKVIALDVKKKLNCSLAVVYQIWDLQDGTIKLDEIKLETYNVMCNKHIDLFRLIPAGLAIDINTI